MGRYQRGYVFHANGAFHIRYYVTALVNGKPERVQKSGRPLDGREAGTGQTWNGSLMDNKN